MGQRIFKWLYHQFEMGIRR